MVKMIQFSNALTTFWKTRAYSVVLLADVEAWRINEQGKDAPEIGFFKPKSPSNR
ncbi:MAG: hypothetical protein M2R45_04984 [Verrucomicrobia subdivision 3 bacterium]|nr:hypothetical protein [Limisphaerales bacterium]MCS1415581.1 hypothetical protein [Limisphaerales bacterium]